MITSTNIAFTILIKINGRQREFNFRKRTDGNYDTNTADDRCNRYIFRVEKEGDTWRLTGKQLPEWLTSSETLIIEALQKRAEV